MSEELARTIDNWRETLKRWGEALARLWNG